MVMIIAVNINVVMFVVIISLIVTVTTTNSMLGINNVVSSSEQHILNQQFRAHPQVMRNIGNLKGDLGTRRRT